MNLDMSTEERLAVADPKTKEWMDRYARTWDEETTKWAFKLLADAMDRSAAEGFRRIFEQAQKDYLEACTKKESLRERADREEWWI